MLVYGCARSQYACAYTEFSTPSAIPLPLYTRACMFVCVYVCVRACVPWWRSGGSCTPVLLCTPVLGLVATRFWGEPGLLAPV